MPDIRGEEVRYIAIFSLGKVGTPANLPTLAHIRETEHAVTASGHTMGGAVDEAIECIQSRYNLQ
jgi:HEAT repeat protein